MSPDPVTSKSLRKPLLVCTLLMLAALLWAVGDDIFGRPAQIRQIYVAEAQIVDRCTTCHTKDHPNPQLLKVHDPARFGCSLCHNGNGIALTSAAKAHGQNRNWAWPLYSKMNTEAGCVQCHERDRVLDHATTLNLGRDLFQQKGCLGCHRHEQYDRDTDALATTRLEVKRLLAQQATDTQQIEREIREGDAATTNDEARRHYTTVENLRVGMSARAGHIADLNQRAKDLEADAREIGPSLKNVRGKLINTWLPVWLKDPQAFRPGTRMPKFRLNDAEIRAVAAFLWQSAPAASQPPPVAPGDPTQGRELYESRGCPACHAADLTNLGQKTTLAWTTRWLLDPRAIAPRTAMPNLRLTETEARDIATYLTANSKPAPAVDLTDPRLAEEGRKLFSRYGCAGCHEIAGFENTPRVGTELTREGSKPLEQLDFGTLQKTARDQHWYNAKGFFEHKLRQPGAFTKDLRMPDIALTPTEVNALTTFLLGSVDVPTEPAFRFIPKQYRYIPEGEAKDIQDGWWLIKKYNCMGCHEMRPGQKSSLAALPRYQDADGKEQLPPALLEEGARVRPDWLLKFLDDPKTGVRPYLAVRMPRFGFSPNELRTLVRFFGALAKQPSTWSPPALAPLDDNERELARALFSSRAAPCLKCHLTGDPRHDKSATAPNFLTAPERLQPGWTLRWITEPQNLSPGTAMPAGLFRNDNNGWVFAGETPAAFRTYSGDHADLLVRYMFHLDAAEQRRLTALLPATKP